MSPQTRIASNFFRQPFHSAMQPLANSHRKIAYGIQRMLAVLTETLDTKLATRLYLVPSLRALLVHCLRAFYETDPKANRNHRKFGDRGGSI
jgi:hypothetical protein